MSNIHACQPVVRGRNRPQSTRFPLETIATILGLAHSWNVPECSFGKLRANSRALSRKVRTLPANQPRPEYWKNFGNVGEAPVRGRRLLAVANKPQLISPGGWPHREPQESCPRESAPCPQLPAHNRPLA